MEHSEHQRDMSDRENALKTPVTQAELTQQPHDKAQSAEHEAQGRAGHPAEPRVPSGIAIDVQEGLVA